MTPRAMPILLLIASVLMMGAAGEPLERASTPEALFEEHTPETFRQLIRAREKINFEKIDFDLLSAAVFHETNLRREKEGLPLLHHQAKVRAAAQMQAKIMAERGSISHVNPKVPGKETPSDRFRLAGLTPGFVAENVATAFGLNYQKGLQVYIREDTGRKVFSREPGGKPIEMHTYVAFAEALLNSWMASPPHRENIMATQPKFLGVSCQPRTNEIGMPMFYCAQEFYTPLVSHAQP